MLASTLRKQLAPRAGDGGAFPRRLDSERRRPGVHPHTGLADRARHTVPGVPVVPFRQLFLGDPAVSARSSKGNSNGETFEGREQHSGA
jgi:hypothetical protein